MNLSELASHLRLYNYFVKSGAAEDKIESFIVNVTSGDVSPEKVIELVYQLYDISKVQSIPLDQIQSYIERKLEEQQKIDGDIKQADAVLQSKNVSIEAINEHIQLNEELETHGLSTHDIHKLLNVLINAKKYGFDGKEIAAKLYNIQYLEWKEKKFKDKRKKLSKRISKYKDIIPFTEEIVALGIGLDELLGLKVGITEASKMYHLPFVSPTLRLIDDMKKYNKINGLQK